MTLLFQQQQKTNYKKELLKITYESLLAGIEQAKPGNFVGDIGCAVQTHAENHGFSVVRELVGHGIGTKLHEEPQIPNYGKSKQGHKLIDSDVVYVITNGRGSMEVVEYMNSDEGHGSDPSYGVEHKDSYDLTAGDVVLVQSGDYCKVINLSEHDQLTYLRIFDRGGWRA